LEEAPWFLVSALSGVSRAQNPAVACPGKSLNPANPAITFAREVPVGYTANSPYKYIRFQPVATKEGGIEQKRGQSKESKPHISGGKFIQLRSDSQMRRFT
jgi:hypothetical protein